MEFKVIKSEKEKGTALKQIKEKKYYEKYIKEKEVYLIGIECSEKERNIVNYGCEKKFPLKKFSDKLNNNPSLDEVLSNKSGNLEGPKGPKL